MNSALASIVVATSAAAMGIAALLWALRITDGARGATRKWKQHAEKLEEQLTRNDSVFSAFPGLILIWEDDSPHSEDQDWGKPRPYGSPGALGSMLRFAEDAVSTDAAVRILQGLAAFEGIDATGEKRRLAPLVSRLRREGAPFALKIPAPDGAVIEIVGRTAGARAVLWITDVSARGVEQADNHPWVGVRAKLAEKPTLFLEIMNQLPAPAWLLSGAGKLEWANDAYIAALDAKSLEQATIRNLLLDQAASEQSRKAIDSGEQTEEVRYIVLNGERRAMRVIMYPVAGGAAGVALDVTEAEESREAIAKQARAHDETLDALSEGIAIFGADKKLIFHNRSFAAMWNLEPGFLVDRPTHAAWLDHLKERRRLPAHSNYAEWRAGELALYQEVAELPESLWHLPEGRTLRVARQRHPLGGILLIFSDKTDELTLKSRYQSLLQVQRAALDRLHEGVIVFGLDGRMQLCNAAFSAMWDLTPAQLEGAVDYDRIVDLCMPLFHERGLWGQIKARITDPSPQARQEFTDEMRRSDSTTVRFLTRPLPDGATLIAFLDITDSRNVEKALRDSAAAFREADDLKTEFVQNISYQLRTPLQTIQGYADALSQNIAGPLNDRQAKQIGSILDASNNLSSLIDNVLDMAMVDAGRMELDLSDVDLYAALRDSTALARTHLKSVDVALRVDCDPAIGSIRADDKRIRQVLFNLLSNALRFTGKGDEIVAGARRIGDEVEVWVADTGRGMAYETQASAFDTFASGDRRGAGLGLTLVRSFVELHNGRVDLESAPGRGTKVTCHLPARLHAAVESQRESA